MLRPALLVALVLLAACRASPPTASTSPSASAPAPAWPELPRTPEAAAELIQRSTKSLPGSSTELTPERILAAADKHGWGTLVAGDDKVVAWLQAFLDRATARGHEAALLFGTYHDAGGQVDAFRRLIGPSGVHGLSLVAVEQFRATGAWRGVPEAAQRGDDAEIAAYTERGDGAAFAALSLRHADGDYAAWKFGYAPSVMELLVTARATGTPFSGCDLPGDAQKLAGAVPEEDRLRLREIHCLQAIAGRAGASARVAMLWGQAHGQPGGFRRFLPPSTDVLAISLVGFRAGAWTTEARLSERVVVLDPILIPLDEAGGEVALIYPDAVLGGDVDRSISAEPLAPGLHVRVEGSGQLLVGDRSSPVGPTPRSFELHPGDHAFAIEVGGLRFLGAIGDARAIDLAVDPKRRAVTRVEHPRP